MGAHKGHAEAPSGRVLGFRTFADDTPREDLLAAPPPVTPFPDPELIDLDPPDPEPARPPRRTVAAPWGRLALGVAVAGAVAVGWSAWLLRAPSTPPGGPGPPRLAVAETGPAALAVEAAPPPQRLAEARVETPPPPATAAVRPPRPAPVNASAPAASRPPPASPPAAPAETQVAEAAAVSAAPFAAPVADGAARGAPAAEPPAAPPPARPLNLPLPRPLDCAAIRSAAQDIVCRDAGLLAADRRMVRAYAAALAAGAPEPVLRADQDDWRAIREQAARRSRQSVENVYHQRIEELETLAGRP